MKVGEFISKEFYNDLFDPQTALNLRKLSGDGLITDLKGPFGSGKEAMIFYTISVDKIEEAVKIHRYSINAFKLIPEYMRIRGKKVVNNLSIINVWTAYEYKYLLKSYKLGINVPKPYRQYRNIIIMKFIGEEGIPAPNLNEVKEFNAENTYKSIIDAIKKMAKAGYTHGDLSPYNIMYFQDTPYIIDFSQAVKVTFSDYSRLVRDINNINNWFSKYLDIIPTENILKELGFIDYS